MNRFTCNLRKVAGHASLDEVKKALDKLSDGEYKLVVTDHKRNRNLPTLTYFFSVVLSYISAQLPDHPSTTALYKYFELMFAPVHKLEIQNRPFVYRELKSEKSTDVNNVIEKVVEYALKEWGIEVPTQDDMRDPVHRELWSQAYLNQEVEWGNFISSRQNISKDERRSKENERVPGLRADASNLR